MADYDIDAENHVDAQIQAADKLKEHFKEKDQQE